MTSNVLVLIHISAYSHSAASHPSACLKAWTENRIMSSAKGREEILRFPNWILSFASSLQYLDFHSIQIGEEGHQHWLCVMSNMQTQLWLHKRTVVLFWYQMVLVSHRPTESSTRLSEGHSHTLLQVHKAHLFKFKTKLQPLPGGSFEHFFSHVAKWKRPCCYHMQWNI